MAIKMASEVGVFFHRRFVHCLPRVVAQWHHPEAYGVALVMLHRAVTVK